MGAELEDLRTMVLEQGLALEGLQRAAADAEERRLSNYAEFLEMMAQMGFGRQQQLSTAVGAGRHASMPVSEHSDVGNGSREGERVPEGAGHFGGRKEAWGNNPTGEQPSNVSGGLSVFFWDIPKWRSLSVLKGPDDFEVFCLQMKVYTKLHGFETVFVSDEYVEIGAEGDEKKSLMAQGV